jgi:NAD-specific glutamate dehydrogenase
LAETTLLVGDGDGLGLASSLVGGGHLHDTVGVDLEGDLNLRDTTRSRRDGRELEFAEEVVILGERPFTLVDLDEDGGLVVGGGREDLALASGDDSVTGDELGHDTTGGLDTESEGADIDKDDLAGTLSSGEDTTLDSGTVGDSLVGVDTLGRLLSEVLLEELLDLGDTGGTTNKDDLVNILLLDTGILEDLFDGLEGLAEEVNVDLLELGPGERLGEVVTVLERLDFDTGGLLAGEGPLGLLDLTLQFTESAEVLGNVGAGLLLVLLDEEVHNAVVEIFTTKMGVTSGSQDLEDTIIDGKEGDIESSSSEIVDDDLGFTTLLVETVGDGGSGGLVDDTEDLETGDGTGILGGLTLSIIEVWMDTSARALKVGNTGNAQAGTVTTAWVTLWPR